MTSGYPSQTTCLTYFGAGHNLLKQSSGVVAQGTVVHPSKDIRRVSVGPDTRSRQISRQKVAQPERAISVFPCLPQVAVDPVERDEIDREHFSWWSFECGTRNSVFRGLDKLKSCKPSVRFGPVVLQPSSERVSRVTNRPQAASRMESNKGSPTVAVDDDEDCTGSP